MTSAKTVYIKEFDSVVVREQLSYEAIKSLRPDAKIATDLAYDLPVVKPATTKEKTIFGGGYRVFRRFRDKLNEIEFLLDATFVNIKDFAEWQDYLNAIAFAKCLITGLHHEVVAACKLRIPFVAYAGNTHKVLGIIRGAGANIPVANNINELLFNIQHLPAAKEYDKLFDFLENQKPFVLADLGL